MILPVSPGGRSWEDKTFFVVLFLTLGWDAMDFTEVLYKFFAFTAMSTTSLWCLQLHSHVFDFTAMSSTSLQCLRLHSHVFDFTAMSSTSLLYLRPHSHVFGFTAMSSNWLSCLRLPCHVFDCTAISSTSLPCLRLHCHVFGFTAVSSNSVKCLRQQCHVFDFTAMSSGFSAMTSTSQPRLRLPCHVFKLINDGNPVFDFVGMAGFKSRANAFLLAWSALSLWLLLFYLFLPSMGWLCGIGLFGLIECSHSLPALHSGLRLIILTIMGLIKLSNGIN